MFRFAHSIFFFAFLLIPVISAVFVLFMIRRKRDMDKYGESNLLKILAPEFSTAKPIIKFVLYSLAVAAVVMALADLQSGSRIEKVKRKGIDLIICLDVSNSMLAQDIRPYRLERAKQAIFKLIDKLEGDRIGLIVFAGKAYTQLPITTDYAAAKLFVSTVNTGMVPTQGTAIGEAIKLAASSFGDTRHNKAIVLITDGEDHEGQVLEQAESASKSGIILYTIGMGLSEGAPIPVFEGDVQTGYKKDKDGNTIISRLDEATLKQIANVGKGMYVRASNSDAGLNTVFEDLEKIEKSDIESKQFSDFESRFQYFAGLALLILVLDLFVFERKTRWIRNIKLFEDF
ncbi:MAG: VWA domain-containing protein [Bacteroidetes bacterium]|nr:VWA domain-containing protein [Bacteroidota bacterium]